jgi:parvulin-like peptidyl-prolyl isomerase
MKKDKMKKIKNVKKAVKKNLMPIVIVLGLLIILAAVLGVTAWRIYYLDSQDRLAEKISGIIPFPAAKIENSYVLYVDYLKTLRSAQTFYEKQEEAGFENSLSIADLKKIVLEERLMKNLLVKQIADEYDVDVSRSEVDNLINEIINSQGSQEDFAKFLDEFYGMTISEYKKYFTIPGLYYQKTSQLVADNEVLNGEFKKTIQDYLNRLRNGEDFDKLLNENKDSVSQQEFTRGALPKALEDQLVVMAEGEYSDVLSAENSFQIIRLNKKDLTKGILNISAIVVPIVSLDNLIESAKNEAEIDIYVY